jgi:hypothetical protein
VSVKLRFLIELGFAFTTPLLVTNHDRVDAGRRGRHQRAIDARAANDLESLCAQTTTSAIGQIPLRLLPR